ncbi:MAG: ribosome recycling factor [Candidatus Shikimatogenerans bostrichidophilus]|nr:MAG: ribosome recycling factor [Candidatus Shikimatogenerans bostrichidophilus]
MNEILNNINKDFNNSLKYFYDYLSNIHFGRANINILKNINININNIKYNILNLANISILDKITIKIIPYEKKNLNLIKNEIFKNKIGGTIFIKDNYIILKLSLFTEDKRLDLIKRIKIELDKTITTLRLIRNKYNNLLKLNNNISEDERKNIKIDIQVLFNKLLLKIKKDFYKKEKEIMNINS